MTAVRNFSLALLLSAGLLFGGMYLFDRQFAAGGVYPEYSTLRTDPMGAALLYDSLQALPGITVERNYRALEFLPDDPRTVFLLAIPPNDFGGDDEPYLRNLEQAARRGNRMVAALTIDSDAEKLPKCEALAKRWNVTVAWDEKPHRHALYFSSAKDWTPLDRIGPQLMVVERSFGKGSVVLFAGSAGFTNQATAAADHLRLITLAIGPNSRIVFDEQHLGIAESGSVMALARRFHLLGFGIGLAFCAALLLWRNGVDFPPPLPAPAAGHLAGRTSQAGLLTLLRRYIPPPALAAACWREWLNGNRGQISPGRLQKAEAIAAGAPGRPLETLREIHAVLHSKGEL